MLGAVVKILLFEVVLNLLRVKNYIYSLPRIDFGKKGFTDCKFIMSLSFLTFEDVEDDKA